MVDLAITDIEYGVRPGKLCCEETLLCVPFLSNVITMKGRSYNSSSVLDFYQCFFVAKIGIQNVTTIFDTS